MAVTEVRAKGVKYCAVCDHPKEHHFDFCYGYGRYGGDACEVKCKKFVEEIIMDKEDQREAHKKAWEGKPTVDVKFCECGHHKGSHYDGQGRCQSMENNKDCKCRKFEIPKTRCKCGHFRDRHTSLGCIAPKPYGVGSQGNLQILPGVCACKAFNSPRTMQKVLKWNDVSDEPIRVGDRINISKINDEIVVKKVDESTLSPVTAIKVDTKPQICLMDGSYDELAYNKGFDIRNCFFKWKEAKRMSKCRKGEDWNESKEEMACRIFLELGGQYRNDFEDVKQMLDESVIPDAEERRKFIRIGTEAGKLVEEKNEAYGSAFAKAGEILKVLYPNGIKPEQYVDALATVRILDKLFRIATRKDAFGESPYKDIIGYGILGAANDEKE